jgi:hypothetical protein
LIVMTVADDERDDVLQSLDLDPGSTLAMLADRLDQVHRQSAPRARLTYRVGGSSYTAGRHEIPALALLLRTYGVSEECDRVALERARGYVASGQVSPPA